MYEQRTHQITHLLNQWVEGDRHVVDQLEPLVREVLYTTARAMLHREWKRKTLGPTELVHEAWVKMLEANSLDLTNRKHFFCLAARIMKNFLINRALAAKAQKKRNWMGMEISLIIPDNIDEFGDHGESQLLELSQALEKLARLDERKERVITLFCFGGFTKHEIASIEEVSIPTIKRELRFGFAWLRAALGGQKHGSQ